MTTSERSDSAASGVPKAERLVMPEGYGATTTTLSWQTIRTRLEQAKQYWLAINRLDASPHVVPVDGLWVDDRLYYGGSPDTLHIRAARSNPQVTIHLPDPWQVVVVQGRVEATKTSRDLAQRLAEQANAKYPDYGITFDAASYTEPFCLHPHSAIAWSSFPSDATKFTFTE